VRIDGAQELEAEEDGEVEEKKGDEAEHVSSIAGGEEGATTNRNRSTLKGDAVPWFLPFVSNRARPNDAFCTRTQNRKSQVFLD
jgi:hypothetical protein